METIEAIKKAVADEREQLFEKLNKMTGDKYPQPTSRAVHIGQLLNTIGERKAKAIVRQHSRGAYMRCLRYTLNKDAARKARVEFAAECARCCGEYWFNVLMLSSK